VDVWNVGKLATLDDDIAGTVGELNPSLFKVRSGDYLTSKVKQSSESSMYEFVHMHVFRQATIDAAQRSRFNHITETCHLGLPPPPPAMQARCKKQDVPYYLVFHIKGPLAGVGQIYSSKEVDLIHIVIVSRVKPAFLAALDGAAPCSNAHRLTQRWLQGCGNDEQLKNRLKCIISAANFEVLNVSKLFESYNGKPFMITKSSTVYRRTHYLEVGINLMVFKRIAQCMFQSYAALYKVLKLRQGLTIQGELKEELPEQMLISFFAHSIDHTEAPIVSGDQNVWLRSTGNTRPFNSQATAVPLPL